MSGGGPILPGATIGVVGGGQLGRMFGLEARRMGYRVIILDPGGDPPAGQIADEQIQAALDDIDAARRLAAQCAVVTLEWENADVAALRSLEEIVPVRPGPGVLEVTQHRIREKDAVRRLGIRTAEYRPVHSAEDVDRALAEIGTPAVLKTCRGGYDAKGQVRLRDSGEGRAAFAALAGGGAEADLILEGWVAFRIEASVITARSVSGEIASFPVVRNIHREGILDYTIAPADVSPQLARTIEEIGVALVEGLDVVGVLAAELFIDDDEDVYVNELAPRPHNSGHYTWEACSVSQFEQQLRAICDLPLPEPELLRPAAMANLLGHEIGTGEGLPGTLQALAEGQVALHLYGKRESRPGRKMGHLTVLAETPQLAYERAAAAKRALIGTAVQGSRFKVQGG